MRAARNSDRSPRSPVRARAVRAECSLAGLTTLRPSPNQVLTHAARAAAEQLNKSTRAAK